MRSDKNDKYLNKEGKFYKQNLIFLLPFIFVYTIRLLYFVLLADGDLKKEKKKG